MRRALSVLLVSAVAAATAVFSVAPAQAGTICSKIVIWSRGAGRYVSAEVGYTGSNYGMLRARASTIGAWERFEICQNFGSVPGGAIFWTSLKSLANNRYVSADWNQSGSLDGMLRAGWATSIGPWEQFQWDTGNVGDAEILSLSSMYYVSAELSPTYPHFQMLRARATQLGSWERFDAYAAPSP